MLLEMMKLEKLKKLVNHVSQHILFLLFQERRGRDEEVFHLKEEIERLKRENASLKQQMQKQKPQVEIVSDSYYKTFPFYIT